MEAGSAEETPRLSDVEKKEIEDEEEEVFSGREDNGLESADSVVEEPRLQLPKKGTVLFSDYIKETRKAINPNFQPIFAAVSHVTLSVHAPPPTSHHRDVWSLLASQFVNRLVPKKKPQPVAILDDVSFFLRPGEMTLLLGAPGCGKSSLLKLLANRLRAGKVDGSLTFNGKVPKRKHYHRDVAFIQQEDVHMATLTVKETLRFSADCQMPAGVPAKVKEERVEAILQLLGLKHRADTIVGDALLRGVSGGEKKRVTVGIEWTKSPGVWLFDEPTTGLDSSASFDVMRALRTIVNMGGTGLVSLLQPSYETFHLFDNVMILTRGEIAFLGKRADALGYFERLGYKCRSTLNPAEFLQEVVESTTSPNPSKYRAVEEAQAEGGEDNAAAVADEDFDWLEPKDFVTAYKESEHYAHVIDTIAETDKHLMPATKGGEGGEEKKSEHPAKIELVDYARDAKYPTSIPMQYWLLTKRAYTREWRDKTTNLSRVLAACALACILGTLFLRLGYNQSDINSRVGLTFAVLAYWAFGSLTALPLTIFERPVFYMQRDQKYYRTSPYLFSTIVAEIPTMMVEVGAFSSILYWLTNLNEGDHGERFGYFVYMSFLFYWMMRSFTRMVSVWCPSLLYAQSFAPTFVAMLLMFGGYLVPRIHIYGWWIWMYWANPVSYAFQGLASNEFWGREYTCSNSELMPPTSAANFNLPYPQGFDGNRACPVTSGTDYIVNSYGIFDREWLKWIMAVCVIGWWLIFTAVTYVGLRFVRHSPPKKARMKSVVVSEEQEREMKQFNIKAVKAEHLKSAHGHSHDHKHHGDHDSMKKMDSFADIEEAQVKGQPSDLGTEKMGGEFVEGGAYLSWHHLNYSVFARTGLKKKELQLLHDVSGYVKPGMMLALMGSSGAGKSTLMDVLARRKTGGKITGDVLVNGRKTDANLSRIIGYVEQQDIHAPTQTIYEAIELSALCRLPAAIPVAEKKKYARSLLKILGLESIANRVIGVNAADGISADQRKRVTIGVEMAADPAILFLDEPTSGLDSFGAERVMTAVKIIASRGTSVVCTIHQPSATIFGMFTHLLLLKKGGFTTYFGEIGKHEGDYSVLLNYFSQMGHTMKPHQNPAEFILEVTGAGIPKTALDQPPAAEGEGQEEKEKDVEMGQKDENHFANVYKQSQFYADTEQKLQAGIFPALEHVDEEEKSRWRKIKERLTDRYASTYLQQFTQTMRRSFLAYWRSPEEFLQKVTVPLVLGVVIGTYFLQLNDTQQGAFQRGGLLYFSLLISNLLGIQLKAKVIQERPFMYRERASRTYTSLVYLAGLVLVEIPFVLFNTVTYVIPVYFISGLQYDAGRFWIFFAIYLLANLLSISIVHAICLASPNITLANALSALVFTLFSNFAGFLITRNNIPGWWIWAHYLDLDMYSIEALLINEVKGMTLKCSVHELVRVPIASVPGAFKEYCPITTGEAFLESLGMASNNLLRDSLVMLGWWIALIVACALLLKFLVHQKR